MRPSSPVFLVSLSSSFGALAQRRIETIDAWSAAVCALAIASAADGAPAWRIAVEHEGRYLTIRGTHYSAPLQVLVTRLIDLRQTLVDNIERVKQIEEKRTT